MRSYSPCEMKLSAQSSSVTLNVFIQFVKVITRFTCDLLLKLLSRSLEVIQWFYNELQCFINALRVGKHILSSELMKFCGRELFKIQVSVSMTTFVLAFFHKTYSLNLCTKSQIPTGHLPIWCIQQKLYPSFLNITVIWYEDQYILDHQQLHCFSQAFSW